MRELKLKEHNFIILFLECDFLKKIIEYYKNNSKIPLFLIIMICVICTSLISILKNQNYNFGSFIFIIAIILAISAFIRQLYVDFRKINKENF